MMEHIIDRGLYSASDPDSYAPTDKEMTLAQLISVDDMRPDPMTCLRRRNWEYGGPVTAGENVWIGRGVTTLPTGTIGG